MSDEGVGGAFKLVGLGLALALLASFIYLNGTFTSYSAGVTSCTTFNDALTLQSSEYCSTLQPINLAPASVTALTPSGKNFTFYDSASGKSAPLVRDARLTLSVQNASPLGFSVTSTCTALVDGKQAATNSTKNVFYETLNGARVCVISIDGKALQEQFATGTSTHLVQYSVTGKATAVFATGAAHSQTFLGTLGNVTITISTPTNATAGSEITVNNNRILLGDGSGSVIYESSSTVTGPTAPLTEIADYTEQAGQVITQSNGYNSPQQVTIDGNTLNVPAGQIGSASYSPTSDGQGTVTVRVTENDKAIYERDAANTARMFGGYENMTPTTRCNYLNQC